MCGLMATPNYWYGTDLASLPLRDGVTLGIAPQLLAASCSPICQRLVEASFGAMALSFSMLCRSLLISVTLLIVPMASNCYQWLQGTPGTMRCRPG